MAETTSGRGMMLRPHHPIIHALAHLLSDRRRNLGQTAETPLNARLVPGWQEAQSYPATSNPTLWHVSDVANTLGYELALVQRDSYRREFSEPIYSPLDKPSRAWLKLARQLLGLRRKFVADALSLVAAGLNYTAACPPIFRAVAHALAAAGVTMDTLQQPDHMTRHALQKTLAGGRPMALDRVEAMLRLNGLAFSIVPVDKGVADQYAHVQGVDDHPGVRMAPIFKAKDAPDERDSYGD